MKSSRRAAYDGRDQTHSAPAFTLRAVANEGQGMSQTLVAHAAELPSEPDVRAQHAGSGAPSIAMVATIGSLVAARGM